MKYSTAQSSRLGNRSNNEDRCSEFIRGNTILLVLTDGMGGHKGGEIAAQATIDTFETIFSNITLPIKHSRSFLQQVLLLAHNAIQERCKDEVDIPRTTCVCCLITDNRAIWAHSGDSRLYLLRENHILHRTRDHSYIEDMVRLNTITEQEAITHPMRNYVTASLGGSSNKPYISISEEITLKAQDIILLCSDGLWSAVDDPSILSILQNNPFQQNLEQSLDQLTDLADSNSYPHSDNTTSIAIKIRDCTQTVAQINEPTHATTNENNDPLQQAIDDIETAYFLYKNEIK